MEESGAGRSYAWHTFLPFAPLSPHWQAGRLVAYGCGTITDGYCAQRSNRQALGRPPSSVNASQSLSTCRPCALTLGFTLLLCSRPE